MLISSVAVGIVFAVSALFLLGGEAKAKQLALPAQFVQTTGPTVSELSSMWDQMRSQGELGKPDPKAREKRIAGVRQLIADGRLQTGGDYFFAAVIVNEGEKAEDALLTHDLCITALTLGERRASRLAALSEDRFLTGIGRPQRFGTQTKAKDGKSTLLPTDRSVSDDMRHVLALPSLSATMKLLAGGQTLAQIIGPLVTTRNALQQPAIAPVGMANAD